MDGGEAPKDPRDDLGHSTPRPKAPQHRQWTHPSEAGLSRRVETDRRRSRLLVVGLVVLGAGALIVTAAMAANWNRGGASTESAARPSTLAGSVAMVERLGSPSTGPLTGLVVDDGRHVLVSGAGLTETEEFAIRTDGGHTTASLVASDPLTDLALLRLEFQYGAAADLAAELTVDDLFTLVHIGADGLRHPHPMIVTSTNAEMMRPNGTLAQGLLALAGTFSGPGPLADNQGRLSGWVMGSSEDQSMAYPVDALMSTVADLLKGGRVEHGWIGVRATSAPDSGGVSVVEVHVASPAELAGIAPGDRIDAIDNSPIAALADLVTALDRAGPGRVVNMTVTRGLEQHTMTVTVGEFPS